MKTLVAGVVCLIVGIVIGQVTAHSKSDRTPAVVASNVSDLSSTRRLAQEIELPAILNDTTVDVALDYLRLRSRQNFGTNSNPADERLAFVLVDPNKTARPVDLRYQSVKMDKLCERIAELSGLTVAFEDDAIVFRAKQSLAEQVVAPTGP